MERRENRTRYALLGLLLFEPLSGYDLRKQIEQTVGNFWSESYGQIYPILKELHREGLVTRNTVEQAGKPDRHVYTITEAGREALRNWLAGPLQRESYRYEILLKLFFGREAPPGASIRLVEEYRERQVQVVAQCRGIEAYLQQVAGEDPNLPYWLSTVRFGRRQSQARLEWCDETLEMLRSRRSDNESELKGEGNV